MNYPEHARVSWLHLSDFHLREKTGWAQDVVLASLLDDICSRYSGSAAPDLLFLTGDIAFAGKTQEYKLAEEFLRRLCAAVGLPTERLCLVPGNHDIDRDLEEDATAGARGALTTAEAVDRFFGSENRRTTLFSRQRAYREFANRVTALPSPIYAPASYAHSRKIQVGALQIRVLLLDSAWLATGGEEDAASLLVGERQVLDCGESDEGCLTFALLHHPLSWLREFEQVPIENLLMRFAHICLRGHVHSHDLRGSEGYHGRLMTFTAGAAFQTRTADNTYLWCSIDLATGEGQKIVHRYNHAQHSWDASRSEPWKLLSSAPAASDISQTYTSLAATSVPFASYVTCLACGLMTDVPITLSTGKIAFVAYDALLPNYENHCGSLIRQLRHHFFWKRVWAPEAWTARLDELSRNLADALTVFRGIADEELRQRNVTAGALVDSLNDGAACSSPVCEEVRALLSQEEFDRARDVLQRWLGHDILRPDEAIELRRLDTLLLLAEGRAVEALAGAHLLLQATGRAASDLALAARCALDANDQQVAATLMHEALDANVPVKSVRTIALRIAGVSGDVRLTQRVRT